MKVILLQPARVEEGPNGGFLFISRFGNHYGPYVDATVALHQGTIEASIDIEAWLSPVGTYPRFIPTPRKDSL